MTMIAKAANKAELKTKLDNGFLLIEPTPWGEKFHKSTEVPIGFRKPVVLDPQTRRRFAMIEKTANGWKVK